MTDDDDVDDDDVAVAGAVAAGATAVDEEAGGFLGFGRVLFLAVCRGIPPLLFVLGGISLCPLEDVVEVVVVLGLELKVLLLSSVLSTSSKV